MPTKRDPRAPCRPNDEPSLHERLLRQLIESHPSMCRNGFWRAHTALVAELGLDEDEFPERAFLPDAYRFDRQSQEVLLYEVEVSCPLSDLKKSNYGWLWFCWDSAGANDWLPRLFVVDRYGNQNELSMCGLYIAETVNVSAKPYRYL